MPTEITIELYDTWGDGENDRLKEAMLEHITECFPEAMGAELEQRLGEVYKALVETGKEYGWTGQLVASLLIKQSAEDKGCGGVPTMTPCVGIDPGSEYVWKVYLGPGTMQYELRCFAVDYTREHDSVQEVDWRTGKKI